MLFFWFGILALSLTVLARSADYFIDSAKKVGLILGISPFFIGVTIVALGTSLPEFLTSLFSIYNHASDMVAGNVIGSNIANILLVVGITAIVAKEIKINRDIINLDLPLLAASTIGLVLMILWDEKIDFFEGVVAVLFYGIYFFYLLKSRQDTLAEELKKDWEEAKEKIARPKMTFSLGAALVLSCFFLFLGAKFTIDAAIKIADLLGIGTSVVALSAVAIGTSLPELTVTIKAARNGDGDMAIGNVFGSNLFNGSLIIGVGSIITPLPVSPQVLYVAVPFLVIATVLYVFSGLSHKVYNYEGAMFVLIYILFLSKLFGGF